MQVFMPFPDFAKSAAALDDRRLRSQINECTVVLRACLAEPKRPCGCSNGCVFDGPECQTFECPKCHGKGTVPTPWYNHPIVVMWRSKSWALECFRQYCIQEAKARGLKVDHVSLACEVESIGKYPVWLSDERIHARYRANLLHKWYMGDPTWSGEKPLILNHKGWKDSPNAHRLYAKPLAPDWSAGYELWAYRTGEKPVLHASSVSASTL